MEPVETEDTNLVYRGTGDVLDLPCYRARPGLIYSYWQPDPGELQLLNDGGDVILGIFTEPIPPVSLGVIGEMKPQPRTWRLGRLTVTWRRS